MAHVRFAMSDYTPTTEEVRTCFSYDTVARDWSDERKAEFNRWLAEELRKAKAEAWEHARRELRAIPHWWNTEDQHGEFDLQPLGPDKTSEQGAFMHVKQIMDNNPYRQGGEQVSELVALVTNGNSVAVFISLMAIVIALVAIARSL